MAKYLEEGLNAWTYTFGAKLKRKTKANTEPLLAGGVLSTETRLLLIL